MTKARIPTLSRGAFSAVLNHGQRVQTSLMTVFWRRAGRLAVGIAVSRKFRTAVQRNRARRRLREVLRQHFELVPEGTEVIWVLQPEVAEVPFPLLVQEFKRTLEILRKRES